MERYTWIETTEEGLVVLVPTQMQTCIVRKPRGNSMSQIDTKRQLIRMFGSIPGRLVGKHRNTRQCIRKRTVDIMGVIHRRCQKECIGNVVFQFVLQSRGSKPFVGLYLCRIEGGIKGIVERRVVHHRAPRTLVERVGPADRTDDVLPRELEIRRTVIRIQTHLIAAVETRDE